MKERFKFRAWNKRDKKMIYNAEDVYDGSLSGWCGVDKENNNDGWISCFGEYLGRDEYVIMQSTGLKDKNGKLIFEGDILQHPQLPHKVVVEWFQCGFWLNGYQNGAKRNLHDACKFYEVIGNIYENKELLGGK